MLAANYKVIRQVEEKQFSKSDLQINILISNYYLIVVIKNKEGIVRLLDISFEQQVSIDLEKHLEAIVSKYDLKMDYKTANVFILTNYFINLPTILSSKEGNKDLLKFTTNLPEGYNVREDNIIDLSICYGISLGLRNYLERTFHNVNIASQASAFINCLLHQTQFSKTTLLINFIGKQMEVGIKKDNKLQLYNLFNYSSTEDALYYILFLSEQFQLNVMQSRFSIIGQMDANDDLIIKLKKYVKHLNFGVLTTPAQIPNHFYFTQLI